jgi:hypothetical protein
VAEESVAADLRTFIARYIDSVAELEALLLLRNNPARKWTLAEIAQRLYTSETETNVALLRLCSDGMAACHDDLYQYGCSPALAQMVDRLAEAYRHQLIPITNLIHSKPRRIREFADAFKLKKDN